MIYFLIQGNQAFITHALRSRLKGRMADRIEAIPYEELHCWSELPAATYVFGNFDLLDLSRQRRLSRIVDQMRSAGDSVRIVNDPAQIKTRYPLLRMLFESGVNDFNVYRVDEVSYATVRFPVFVRYEHGHAGAITPLIDSYEDLSAKLRWLARGAKRASSDLLVVEFCDTSAGDRFFRKYSAFRIGDQILPRCLNFSTDWVVKHSRKAYVYASGEPRLDRIEEEESFMRTNPDEARLRSVFEAACIEYGRIDYGRKDGRIQVWEINTYPTVGGRIGNRPSTPEHERFREARAFTREYFYDQMESALEAFVYDGSDRGSVPISIPRKDYEYLDAVLRRMRRRTRMKRLLGITWLHGRSRAFSRWKRRFGPALLGAIGR